MFNDTFQCLCPDLPFADFRMTVFVGTAFVQTVVKMNGIQPVQADHPVKFGEHFVQMIDNIISGVPDMTGVKTDADLDRKSVV